ncbi:MAG: PASTA domain-containing protein [Candidatus Zixiibacteriota bacterium]
MTQVRATRLENPPGRAAGFLSDKLPYGSWQRRAVMWGGAPLLVLLVIYFFINALIMPAITRHGDEFVLPGFLNQKMAEVQIKLDELGLEFEIASQEYSPGKEQGIILNQYPTEGTKVKNGRTIKFVVSLGQKLVPIPNLTGLSVRQAILDLETAGLELGEIAWAFSDTLPEKVVVFSYPASGREIPLGSPVNIMVNRGRASDFTYMPRVIGMNLEKAKKILGDKSLKLGLVTHRADENYLPETVLEQSEQEGTELDVGTEIDLVVSSTD